MFKAAYVGLAILGLTIASNAVALNSASFSEPTLSDIEARMKGQAAKKPRTFEELDALIRPQIMARPDAKAIEDRAYVFYVGGACSHIPFEMAELARLKGRMAKIKAADDLEAGYFDLAWQDGERFAKSDPPKTLFDKTQCRRAFEKAFKSAGV